MPHYTFLFTSLLLILLLGCVFYCLALCKKIKRIYLESQQLKERNFLQLSELSHDLRTPLNAIMGYTSLLKNNVKGDLNDKQKDYIDKITSNSNRLLKIMEDYFISAEG